MKARVLTALAAVASLLLWSSPGICGELDAAGDDATYEVPFVPGFDGALTTDVRFTSNFSPFSSAFDLLPDLGVAIAAGYKHFFDHHGAFALAVRGRGGVAGSADGYGDLAHIGGEIGLGLRGYTDQFLFAEIGLVASADYLSWGLSDDAMDALGSNRESLDGYRVGGGIATDLGLLWYLRPYLFGQIGAVVSVDYLDLGGSSGAAVSASWHLRIDWAFPTEDPLESTQEERDELFDERLRPTD